MEDHGVARFAGGTLDGPDHTGEEGVPYAPDHQSDGVGRGLYQIPGAVVGHIMGLPHHRHHLFPVGGANVRMIVQDPGHCADGHAAALCDILDGHSVTVLSCFVKTLPGTFSVLTFI